MRSFHLKGPETAALPIYQTDELWLDDSKVVADGDAQAEKPNIGKKRKSLDGEAEPAAAIEEAPKEKEQDRPKKKTKKVLPESNDENLDKEIAARKEKLKKQKAAAKAKKAVAA